MPFWALLGTSGIFFDANIFVNKSTIFLNALLLIVAEYIYTVVLCACVCVRTCVSIVWH